MGILHLIGGDESTWIIEGLNIAVLISDWACRLFRSDFEMTHLFWEKLITKIMFSILPKDDSMLIETERG